MATPATERDTSLWSGVFVLFWLGNSLSFFGSSISLVALPLLALVELDAHRVPDEEPIWADAR